MQNRTATRGAGRCAPLPAAPPGPALEPGTILQGTYRIGERLAVGGMGEVYATHHERLVGRFAVKILQHEFDQSPEALARFDREAVIMSGLRHPHIAQVVDFNVTDDGRPYLVMELLEGRRLSELIAEGRPLPLVRVASIVRQIASALEAAHGRGIVHRDLKPDNVILLPVDGDEAFVKVFDFGISKIIRSGQLTCESAVLGTPEYMAPEQALGRIDAIDHRTDQFALAAVTYALLAGRHPFQADSAVDVLYQVIHREPRPLADFVDWPVEEVEAVLHRGLAKRAQDRFASVLEFSRALDIAVASVLADTGRIVIGPGASLAAMGETTEIFRLAEATQSRVGPAPGDRRRRSRFPLVSFCALAFGALAVAAAFHVGGWDLAHQQVTTLWRAVATRLAFAPPAPAIYGPAEAPKPAAAPARRASATR
jgi:serine/threonine protein kinase